MFVPDSSPDGVDAEHLRLPEVSVVIPTYNGATTIKAAIESVLAQTLRDFELIVVDDGSTDETAEIIAAVADSRIRRIYHRTNEGVGRSYSTGIEAAIAPLIAILDHDDTVVPVWLERLVHAAQSESNTGLIWGWSRTQYKHSGRSTIASSDPFHGNYSQLLPTMLSWTPATTGILIRRAVVESVGMLDPCAGYLADRDFTLRCALQGDWGIRIIPEVLLYHYIHDTNLSGKIDIQNYDALRYFVNKHSVVLSQWPRVLASYSWQLGRRGEILGTQDANSYLQQAIRLHPTAFKYRLYWYLKRANALAVWQLVTKASAARTRLRGHWRDLKENRRSR